MLAYPRIGRPLEAHEVHSAQDYRGWQAAVIQHNRVLRPSRPWRDPFAAAPVGQPEIRQGRWGLACTCGNWPSYDPDWRIACCPDCGAIYDGIAPPDDTREIEAVLMERPRMVNRNYVAGDTLASLRAENAAHLVEAG